MVLEIRLSNFFSIKEEIVLDLRAGNINTQQANELRENTFKSGNETLLKTAAIYGANASGKSNILKAIRFCVSMVLDSHTYNENTVFNYKNFKYEGYPTKPSSFHIRFLSNGVEYEYSFTLSTSELFKEELWYYPKGKRAKVFTRDENAGASKNEIYSFGPSVIKRPMDVATSTSRKSLYLSRASQMDRDLPKQLFRFFNDQLIMGNEDFSLKKFRKINKATLIKALQIADSDISDIKVEENIQTIPVHNVLDFETGESSIEHYDERTIKFTSIHKNHPEVEFDFVTEESDGTKHMFLHLIDVVDATKHGKILFIDEIEKSLHPEIVEYLINLFHASKSAQLIFTTHNTHLLDLKRFRKDQIYFANKKEDGETDLYSLYDYKDFRDTMNLEKAYLQGRFDAVPIVDDYPERLKELVE